MGPYRYRQDGNRVHIQRGGNALCGHVGNNWRVPAVGAVECETCRIQWAICEYVSMRDRCMAAGPALSVSYAAVVGLIERSGFVSLCNEAYKKHAGAG